MRIIFRPIRLNWHVKDEKIRPINELAVIVKDDRRKNEMTTNQENEK